MSMPVRKPDAPVTYGDYRRWPNEERREIIEGAPHDMGPAPSTTHQRVIRKLIVQIDRGLPDRAHCEAFFAPFDVRLPEGNEADDEVVNVVQPDISVICDPARIDDRGCRGAPDWIIEVLSPGSAARDHIAKRALYERSGVREYWLVHPTDELITVFALGADGRFEPPVFHEGKGTLEVGALPGLTLDLDAVFRTEA